MSQGNAACHRPSASVSSSHSSVRCGHRVSVAPVQTQGVTMDNDVKKVAVIGAGLVGSLQACYMARRGYRVDLYELRPDIRKQEVVKGRSINLALSRRGREALKGIGMEEEVIRRGVPMYARMIHDRDGTLRPIPYGKGGQHIMSTDRRLLNEVLLTEAEKQKNVRFFFEKKLKQCNFDTGECEFEVVGTPETLQERYDLIIACDGAFSAVRKQVMRSTRLDYSQTYIPHGYMELSIPPIDGEYAMATNYLHIWARDTFMMIALPNGMDKSFVVTLFMPFAMFEDIQTEKDLLNFFTEIFPDSIPLIGKEALIKTYFSSKPLPLVSVKCSPHHVGDKVVMLGDAAHAMVPFYGQGMNCGFEDCIVFREMMDKYNDDIPRVLREYTVKRTVDAQAICDLAMMNYIEMRSSVNSTSYLLRKKIDGFLNWLLPSTWVPLYTMVSFTRTRYSECIARRKWQDKMLGRFLSVCGVSTVTTMAAILIWLRAHPDRSLQSLLPGTTLITQYLHRLPGLRH